MDVGVVNLVEPGVEMVVELGEELVVGVVLLLGHVDICVTFVWETVLKDVTIVSFVIKLATIPLTAPSNSRRRKTSRGCIQEATCNPR